MATAKRSLKFLTLHQKVEIIDKIDKGVIQSKLAREYGVDSSTICRIFKNRNEIKQKLSNTYAPNNRKTLKCGEYPEMENRVYKFFMK